MPCGNTWKTILNCLINRLTASSSATSIQPSALTELDFVVVAYRGGNITNQQALAVDLLLQMNF